MGLFKKKEAAAPEPAPTGTEPTPAPTNNVNYVDENGNPVTGPVFIDENGNPVVYVDPLTEQTGLSPDLSGVTMQGPDPLGGSIPPATTQIISNTAAQIETPQPIVEQQIAYNIDPAEVFEGGDQGDAITNIVSNSVNGTATPPADAGVAADQPVTNPIPANIVEPAPAAVENAITEVQPPAPAVEPAPAAVAPAPAVDPAPVSVQAETVPQAQIVENPVIEPTTISEPVADISLNSEPVGALPGMEISSPEPSGIIEEVPSVNTIAPTDIIEITPGQSENPADNSEPIVIEPTVIADPVIESINPVVVDESNNIVPSSTNVGPIVVTTPEEAAAAPAPVVEAPAVDPTAPIVVEAPAIEPAAPVVVETPAPEQPAENPNIIVPIIDPNLTLEEATPASTPEAAPAAEAPAVTDPIQTAPGSSLLDTFNAIRASKGLKTIEKKETSTPAATPAPTEAAPAEVPPVQPEVTAPVAEATPVVEAAPVVDPTAPVVAPEVTEVPVQPEVAAPVVPGVDPAVPTAENIDLTLTTPSEIPPVVPEVAAPVAEAAPVVDPTAPVVAPEVTEVPVQPEVAAPVVEAPAVDPMVPVVEPAVPTAEQPVATEQPAEAAQSTLGPSLLETMNALKKEAASQITDTAIQKEVSNQSAEAAPTEAPAPINNADFVSPTVNEGATEQNPQPEVLGPSLTETMATLKAENQESEQPLMTSPLSSAAATEIPADTTEQAIIQPEVAEPTIVPVEAPAQKLPGRRNIGIQPVGEEVIEPAYKSDAQYTTTIPIINMDDYDENISKEVDNLLDNQEAPSEQPPVAPEAAPVQEEVPTVQEEVQTEATPVEEAPAEATPVAEQTIEAPTLAETMEKSKEEAPAEEPQLEEKNEESKEAPVIDVEPSGPVIEEEEEDDIFSEDNGEFVPAPKEPEIEQVNKPSEEETKKEEAPVIDESKDDEPLLSDEKDELNLDTEDEKVEEKEDEPEEKPKTKSRSKKKEPKQKLTEIDLLMSSSPITATRFCDKCGAMLGVEDQTICPNCGEPIE